MEGKRFGRLTVVSQADEEPSNTLSYWTCRCSCGKTIRVRAQSLMRERGTRSCGCLRTERIKKFNQDSETDLTGKRFGRWTVLGRPATGGGWSCKCDCGTQKTVSGRTLRDKESRSCGCYKRDAARKRRLTHGLSHTDDYKLWQQILDRCSNRNCPHFKHYGGRGISVCRRWLKFENFIADMGPRPSRNHSIERRNVDGHYAPSNCSWIYKRFQPRNKRTNRNITAFGRTQCAAAWSEETGVKYTTIISRLNRGDPPERALRQ